MSSLTLVIGMNFTVQEYSWIKMHLKLFAQDFIDGIGRKRHALSFPELVYRIYFFKLRKQSLYNNTSFCVGHNKNISTKTNNKETKQNKTKHVHRHKKAYFNRY